MVEEVQRTSYGMPGSVGEDEMAVPFITSEPEDEEWTALEDVLAYFEDEEAVDVDEDATREESAAVDAEDALSLYLNQMGALPLLTPEEETTLAKSMERGRQAREQLEARADQAEQRLTHDQIAELERQIEEGRQARQHFIEANTRLVVSEAKHYRGSGLSFLDLIQAGNIGLIKAVDRFDYRFGNKFSTYAVWWIRQTIRRALTRQGYTIRLPAHLRQRIQKFHHTARRLEKTLARRPTPAEIATALGIEDAHSVYHLLQIGRRTLSLNASIDGKDGESEFVDFIEDKDMPSPIQQVQERLMQEDLKTLLTEVLTPREHRVLRKRFGFEGEIPQTLQALADDLGVSRERVRQIERRALRKLRHPASRYKLREYSP